MKRLRVFFLALVCLKSISNMNVSELSNKIIYKTGWEEFDKLIEAALKTR